MKVKEYDFPKCKVTIHDDYIVDEEEKKRILDRVGRLTSSILEEKLQKIESA